MAPTIIYITGFRQHAGKTVTSLGLISLLQDVMDPERIGYIKPVGQELVSLPDGSKVDKDAMIIRKFGGIPDIDMRYVSPVRLGSGFTKDFLTAEHPEIETEKLKRSIREAIDSMDYKSIIIAEGTGHPGVGGIVGLSNAHVANLMDAQIIYLSGGGIGKALDMLEVDLTFFMYHRCKVRGIIFNKVFQDKLEQTKQYLKESTLNSKYCFDKPMRILGYLPEVDDLPRPSMSVIREHFKGACVIGQTDSDVWKKPCNKIRVISLQDEYLNLSKYLSPGDLVVIGVGSARRISRIINYSATMKNPLGGIMLTCGTESGAADSLYKDIEESGIPAMVVLDDTATTEATILEAYENTKLQIYDDHKYQEIRRLFRDYFDFNRFVDAFNIGAE